MSSPTPSHLPLVDPRRAAASSPSAQLNGSRPPPGHAAYARALASSSQRNRSRQAPMTMGNGNTMHSNLTSSLSPMQNSRTLGGSMGVASPSGMSMTQLDASGGGQSRSGAEFFDNQQDTHAHSVAVESLFGHTETVQFLLTPTARTLVTVSKHRARIWSHPPMECVHQLDSQYDDDPRARLNPGELVARQPTKETQDFFTSAGADERRLVLGCADGVVRVYDHRNGRRKWILKPTTDPDNGFERSNTTANKPDKAVTCVNLVSSDRAITGCQRGEIRIWDLEWGRLLWLMRGHSGALRGFHIVEPLMLSWDDHLKTSEAQLWDLEHIPPLENDKTKGNLQGHDKPISACLMDDDLWFTGADDFTIRAWHPRSLVLLKTFRGHVKSITSIRRPSKGTLVTGSVDGYVRIWDIEHVRELVTLTGHHFHVVNVFVEGNYVISGSLDGSLRVWDIRTASCISVINVGRTTDPMTSLCQISGNEFLGAFPDGGLRMWNIANVTGGSLPAPANSLAAGPGGFHPMSRASPAPKDNSRSPFSFDQSPKTHKSSMPRSIKRARKLPSKQQPMGPDGRYIPLQVCGNRQCRRKEDKPFQFQRCSQCKSAYYCNPLCQEEDWFRGQHWRRCKRLPRKLPAVFPQEPANTGSHQPIEELQNGSLRARSSLSSHSFIDQRSTPSPDAMVSHQAQSNIKKSHSNDYTKNKDIIDKNINSLPTPKRLPKDLRPDEGLISSITLEGGKASTPLKVSAAQIHYPNGSEEMQRFVAANSHKIQQ